MRLVDGSQDGEGRVVFCYERVWMEITVNNWGKTEAAIVCQQLGYSNKGKSS